MSYKRKSDFNSQAYAVCDPAGKAVLTQYLNRQGIFTLAKEDYHADIGAIRPSDPSLISFHECEIKSGWTGPWPERFKTVDIPFRKHALLHHHRGHKLTFWVISGDLKYAWKIPCKELTEDRVGWKYTTRRPDDEFYRIPVSVCELVKLKED